MNKQRRKRIMYVLEDLQELETFKKEKNVEKYCDLLDSVDEPLEDIIEEEQEALDNLPENMMFSQRADDMQDIIMDLGGAQIDLGLASERIRARGKWHGSDTKMIRNAINTLRYIAS